MSKENTSRFYFLIASSGASYLYMIIFVNECVWVWFSLLFDVGNLGMPISLQPKVGNKALENFHV